MSNAIGSSRESNPSRRICSQLAVGLPLCLVADEGAVKLTPLVYLDLIMLGLCGKRLRRLAVLHVCDLIPVSVIGSKLSTRKH